MASGFLQSPNPQFEQYVRHKISLNRYMEFLGFEIDRIEPGYIHARLPFREMHAQQNGYLHGGVTSAMLDMVQGFAAYSMVPDGQQVFTVEAKTSYLNRGMGTLFFAEGWVIKPGKRFHFCEGTVYYLENNDKIIVARGSATMANV